MSRIKSALELALERSSDVPVDKESIQRDEWKRKGRTLGGQFISGQITTSLDHNIKAPGSREDAWFCEGIVETLLANITLPRLDIDISRLEKVSQGIQTLAARQDADVKSLKDLFNQLRNLFRQYLENVDNMEQQIRQQWIPRLRQKEQALRQQTGQSVNLSPEQDPEFSSTLTNQLNTLSGQYNEVIQRGKSEINRIMNQDFS